MDKHYDPIIARRLRLLVEQRDWTGIIDYLPTLSNAGFRVAGYMLGERFMVAMVEDDFWMLSQMLVQQNAKAFLVTLMKCAALRVELATLDLHGGESFFVLLAANPVDRQKAAQTLLPVLRDYSLAEWLLSVLDINEPVERVALLLRCDTAVSAFLLLRALRFMEGDRPFLVRTAYHLMKRHQPFDFNLASLICSIHGLDEVKGTFSLRLEPYQLDRVEKNYDAFKQVINY